MDAKASKEIHGFPSVKKKNKKKRKIQVVGGRRGSNGTVEEEEGNKLRNFFFLLHLGGDGGVLHSSNPSSVAKCQTLDCFYSFRYHTHCLGIHVSFM